MVAVSAATFEAGAVAADSVVAAFGANLATRVETGTSVPLPTSLAGTTVRVRDSQNTERFAQLFFVAPTQVNFVIPTGTTQGEATITIITGEGITSVGRLQIARVSPGIFTANASGKGLPAAIILRVAANGTQTTQRLARFEPDQNRFVPEPIDLGTEAEQVFIIMFATGVRGRASVNDVSVRLGGLEGAPNLPVTFAQAQGTLVGVDQINIGPINRGDVRTRLAGRGLVNFSLAVIDPTTGTQKLSNTAEVEIAGLRLTTPPTVGEPTQQTFLAGQNVVITGGPFLAGNLVDNRVRIGSQQAQVISAATDRLTVQLPFGIQTGRITVNTPSGEATSTNQLQVGTSVSGIVETSDRQPLGGVLVKALVTNEQTTTKPDGSFILPINLTTPPNTFFTTLLITPQGVRGFETHGSISQRVEVNTKRDNRLAAPISLTSPNGRSSGLGNAITLTLPVFPCGGDQNATAGDVIFTLEAGAAAQFPNDALTNQITLSQIQNCRTPKPLPASIYSSRIVQLTPLGTRLNPGGQLSFPNSDNLAGGTQLTLYRLDQRSDSPTLGSFIEAGTATVNGPRIETGFRAITEGGIYFVALSTSNMTSVTGRVVERISDTVSLPVIGAMVQVRGQAGYTDGDGAFVIRYVPVNSSNDSLMVEARLLRPDGRADSVLRTVSGGVIKLGGVTALTPDLFFASLSSPANRAPSATSQSVTLDEDTTKVIFLQAGDPDGNPIRYVLTQPSNGTLSGVAPNLIYTPNPNYNGTDNFTFKVNDGKADSNTAVVAITVNPVNDPPVLIVPGPQTVKKNTNLTFEVSATDVDTGQTVSITAPARPEGASFIESTRRFTWTPNCRQAGSYTVTFVAVDSGSPIPLSDTKTVQITVTEDNCPPSLILPAPPTVNEGQTLAFTVTAVDPEGNTVTLSAANLPAGSNFTASTGQFTWTPSCTQAGGYLPSFTATDNGNPARSETRTLAITVNNVSVPPTVSTPQDTYNISEGQQVVFTITALQGCPNQNLTINTGNLPSGSVLGELVQNGPRVSREFRWTPNFTQSGTYPITFTAADGNDANAISTKLVTINVVDFNLDPQVNAPATPLTVNVGQQLIFNVSATDPDASQTVTLTAAGVPAGATFNTAPGNPATGTLTFTPNFAQVTNFTVTFTATDNGQPQRTVSRQVIIIVSGECDPLLTVPGIVNAVEGLPVSFTVLGAPKCPGQTVTLSATNLPPRATFVAQTGEFNWTPNIGEAATYTITFAASDNSTPPRVITRPVMITVAANRAPLAASQTVTLDEDTPKALTLVASDPENQTLTYSILQAPQHGTLTGTPPNVTYNPTANFNGPDAFTFKANDGRLDSNIATVSLTVTPVNDAPVAQGSNIAISEDAPGNLILQASDVDGDPLTFTITKQPSNGTLSGTAPNLIYTPNPNFFGTDEVRFRASDGKTNSNEAVIGIIVTSVNDAPTITVPGPQSVITGQPVSFTVTAADVDANDTLTLTATNTPAGSTFTQTNATTGQFTWTPTEAQAGSFTVTFAVRDNGLPMLSATNTVTIVVSPQTTNITIDAPSQLNATENQQVSFTVSAAGGTQGQPFTLNATAGLPQGAVFPAQTSNGSSISQTFTWTPDFSQAGTFDITFTATRGVTANKVVRIIVANVCRPPVLTVPLGTVNGSEGQPLTFNVSATDPDTGETLTLTSPNLPAGATFPVATSTSGTIQQAFNWTPAFNQAGSYTVSFNVTDNCSPAQQNDTKTVSISIADVNRAPVANPQTGTGRVTTLQNTQVNVTLTGSDPDNDTISFAVLTTPQHGSLSGSAPNLSYTPANNFSGTDSFTFKVNDGKVDSPAATVEIGVTSVCQAPVLTVPANQTINLTIPQDCATNPVAQPVTFNVTATDPNANSVITLTAQGLPSGATFTQTNTSGAAAAGTFNWTPSVFNEARTFTVTFTA
ncbi:MAG: tandem-95 repeat protein, partial [Acidobacteria bacterium]|nr:tandem-95 repeat protein [Acidobacteriota bacterium]